MLLWVYSVNSTHTASMALGAEERATPVIRSDACGRRASATGASADARGHYTASEVDIPIRFCMCSIPAVDIQIRSFCKCPIQQLQHQPASKCGNFSRGGSGAALQEVCVATRSVTTPLPQDAKQNSDQDPNTNSKHDLDTKQDSKQDSM